MKFGVAIPLFAICLASPAFSSGEQVKKGRGYSPRESGGSGQTAERSGGDDNRSGSARERTADNNNRPSERREETRTAEAAPEPQRYAVPKDNGGSHVANRPPDSRQVFVTRHRPDYNNGSSYRGPRYYAPAHYDYWARRYYRWSPIGYAPWSLIYGSIGYSNFGFYGGIGPGPYPLGPYSYGYNGYGYGAGPYSPWPAGGYDIGGIRLKIRPHDAQVFVDGYYAGLVDDFDGTFQSLRLEQGPHKIEVRMPGFQTFEIDVHIQPGRTLTISEDLHP